MPTYLPSNARQESNIPQHNMCLRSIPRASRDAERPSHPLDGCRARILERQGPSRVPFGLLPMPTHAAGWTPTTGRLLTESSTACRLERRSDSDVTNPPARSCVTRCIFAEPARSFNPDQSRWLGGFPATRFVELSSASQTVGLNQGFSVQNTVQKRSVLCVPGTVFFLSR